MIEAINKYKKALESLNPTNENLDSGQLSAEVNHAVELLRQDIDARIRELESIIELQKPPSKDASAIGSIVLNMNPSMQGMGKSRSWQNAREGSPASGLHTDPVLVSILNKLQSNLTTSVTERPNDVDSESAQGIEAQVSQHIARFRRELGLYEQKKFKEYNVKLDQAIKENKKLSNQIVKLRERWDSLVESAKQRRNRQQDD